MKQIYIFLFLAFIVVISSCKSDDVVIPNNLQNSKLLGKWNLKMVEVSTAVDNDAPTNTLSITDFTDKDYLTIKENNEAVFSLSTDSQLRQGYYSYTSSAAKDVFTFKSGNLILSYDVISLSAKELILAETSSAIVEGKINTTIEQYTYIR
jgi:hypothetical protein